MLKQQFWRVFLFTTLSVTLSGCGKEQADRSPSTESAAPQEAPSPQDLPAAPEYSPQEYSTQVQPMVVPEPQAQRSIAPPAPTIFTETAPLESLPPVDPAPQKMQPSFTQRSFSNQNEPQIARMEAAPMEAAPPEAMQSFPEPAEPAPPQDATESDASYDVVRVYYATDRNAIAEEISVFDTAQRGWLMVLSCSTLAMCLGAGALLMSDRRRILGFAALLSLMAAGGVYAYHEKTADFASAEILLGEAEEIVDYGGDRGEMHLGVCEVSIPPNHRVGKLEAPSILRLEFKENPENHVMLMSIKRRSPDEYFEDLADTIAASSQREALVFVHGFNVGFDDAVRRTAQIAYDLKFEGAPICYSWPSQASTFAYTVDENNVVWTVPHLKQFLLDVIDRTGAQSINLVAHSMGNRALTSAVRELTLELRNEEALFNEIVLAAPDIDAEVFQRDLAPALARAGKRVTLYASSNDQALAASRAVHGYPRAGETGARLVVVPGIDTIDVSAIDTSLLGHNYYGDSSTLLYDMHSVIRYSLPADRRNMLQPMLWQSGLRFWVFQPPYGPVARPTGENLSR